MDVCISVLKFRASEGMRLRKDTVQRGGAAAADVFISFVVGSTVIELPKRPEGKPFYLGMSLCDICPLYNEWTT